MTRSNYVKKELGKAIITIEHLQGIAKFYKVDLSELFEFSGNEPVIRGKIIDNIDQSGSGIVFKPSAQEKYSIVKYIIMAVNDDDSSLVANLAAQLYERTSQKKGKRVTDISLYQKQMGAESEVKKLNY